MTIEERMGQFLFVGLPGPRVDAESREFLRELQPGGVVLFRHNIEAPKQVAELNAAIRTQLRIPPFISVDQEGGPVDRLKEIGTPMPAARDVRATEDTSMAARLGEVSGELLRLLGFNMNFAPVLDLEVHAEARNALAGRYFGTTAAEVIRFAGAYLDGLQRAGIVGCGKHFPGLGDSVLDSHETLPTVARSGELLRAQDLLPYVELAARLTSRLDVVMVAHASYPAFDGQEIVPATLSTNVATTLLRDELEFKGLALSDDMEMGAITERLPVGEAAVRTIEAGLDQALVCQTSAAAVEAFRALVAAAQEGRISATRRRQGLDRIARVKSILAMPGAFNEGTFARVQEKVAAVAQQVAAMRELQGARMH
jgi:beta-N-acetylhexosaminidase